MIMKWQAIFTLGAVLSAATHAWAVPTLTLDLGPAILNGGVARISVFAAVVSDGGGDLVEFNLDLSNTDSALTSGGNFNGFSFVPGTDIADWSELEPLGPLSFDPDQVEYDVFPTGTPLPDGDYTLGEIVIDLSATGVAPGTATFIRIDGLATGALFDDLLNITDADIQYSSALVEFAVPQPTVSAIPEPATVALALIGSLCLAWMCRSRHHCQIPR